MTSPHVEDVHTKRPKNALTVLARLAFVLAVGLIGCVVLGLCSHESKGPRVAEDAPSLHQTRGTQDDSAVDSVSWRGAR